jgi:hypothetical protein
VVVLSKLGIVNEPLDKPHPEPMDFNVARLTPIG